MTPEQNFQSKVARYMGWLGEDLKLDADSAAAVFGNLGHECLGFTVLQEIAPAVKGSKGGYGWAQWTGPRRRAFEAWCARNKLLPSSEAANYGFLVYELQGSEARAVAAVSKAKGLEQKVIAFEQAYERAGVKTYNSRLRWAVLAQQTWHASLITAAHALSPDVPAPKPRSILAWVKSKLSKGTA